MTTPSPLDCGQTNRQRAREPHLVATCPSSAVPACDTNPAPSAVSSTVTKRPSRITLKVKPPKLGIKDFSNPRIPAQADVSAPPLTPGARPLLHDPGLARRISRMKPVEQSRFFAGFHATPQRPRPPRPGPPILTLESVRAITLDNGCYGGEWGRLVSRSTCCMGALTRCATALICWFCRRLLRSVLRVWVGLRAAGLFGGAARRRRATRPWYRRSGAVV